MTERSRRTRPRPLRSRTRRVAWLVSTLVCAGCERAEPPQPNAEPPPAVSAPAVAARQINILFPETQRQVDPAALAILDELFESLRRVDYARYRSLVSPRVRPLTQERFEKISEGLQTIRVIRLEPTVIPEVTARALQAVLLIEIEVEQPTPQRRKWLVELLLFEEGGAWTLIPQAMVLQDEPSATQPATQPATQAATAPGAGERP